ncbi:uncharacterized protein LOC122507505 [Leptopilina heterotoma]|uniref:uncharacterized protein LOC122507505 n=1 Tax=Leptopilina heterotoma TaxID=63436 RepID=UPI001CA8518E|nr:uncharacterized protein LOC122507505 [Leptopilina heterotoma]
MNFQHYEEWFIRILQTIPSKSVIVLDQATYHKMLDPEYRNPTRAWKKQKIIDLATKQNVPLPASVTSFQELLKPELLEMCKPYYNPKTCLLDTVAKELRGEEVKILWLPVAHCEFNPIELIWAYVKNYVAKHNTTFKLQDVQNLCLRAMDEVDKNLWEKFLEHAIKEEKKYRLSEPQVQQNIDSMIIEINNESDDSDEEFDTDSN